MPTADIKDVKGQRVGSLTLTAPVFVEAIQRPLLWQSVKAYLANRRQGTAQTKTRGEVHGGGRKPWKQKGTGRARQSSIRSPLWRGGGVVFGPHPRDYRVHQPQAVRRQALLSSLEAKWQDGAVTIVQSFALEAPKTRWVAQALKALGVQGRALVLVDAPDPQLARAARNLRGITIKSAVQATAYDVLAHRALIITEAAWQHLQALKKKRAVLEGGPFSESGER